MAYSYDYLDARDPSNPAVKAANASITIFAVGDAAKTPLTLTTLDGQPLANPVTVNANGYGPPFLHATLDRVAWAGGGFEGTMTSYEGMKAEAVGARVAADTAAANAATAASLVAAPADTAMQTLINNGASATRGALNATYAGLIQLAKNPDTLIAGAVTVDASNLVTSAAVLWPDGTPGTLTITSRDGVGAVLGYNITYGSPVTKTFTQPTITRNAAGAATNVPQIVVS